MAIAEEARAIGTPDKPVISSFSIERFDPQRYRDLSWLGLPLTKESLAGIEIQTYRRYTQTESRLFQDFRDPKSSIILLGNPVGLLIGYAYATGENIDSATLRQVAVDPKVKESGAVEKMMMELEKDLVGKGVLTMEGYLPVQNGNVDRIARVFEGRIIEDESTEVMRFLRVDLRAGKK